MTRILHLAPAAALAALGPDDAYAPASLAAEGFVHACADDATLLAVANAFYRDDPAEHVVLVVETDALSSRVVWEAPAHPGEAERLPEGARFPHVYGPLERAAIVEVRPTRRAADGRFLAV